MALTDNLVAYYSLEETSGSRADATGRGNTLTDNNTVTSGTGKVGTAASFAAASSEYLSIADNADVSMTGSFTIACWVNFTTLAANRAILSKSNATTPVWSYELSYGSTASRLRFLLSGDGTNNTTVTWSAASSTGTWYFVVIQYDSVAQTISINVNNGTAVSVSHTAGVFDNTQQFRIGARPDNTTFMNGLIDEVSIWKRVLTSTELTALYNSGSGISFATLATATGTASVQAATATVTATGTALGAYSGTANVQAARSTVTATGTATPSAYTGIANVQAARATTTSTGTSGIHGIANVQAARATVTATGSYTAPAIGIATLTRQPAQIALWDAPGGTQISDLSARLTQATMETDEHGCASLALTARLPLERAFALMNDALGAHLTVALDGGVVWAGRVEEPGINLDTTQSELTLTAYGYQQAFDDLPYTALWSDSSYDRWYAWQTSFTSPEKYTLDQSGRLFIGVKGSTYGNATETGIYRYDIPAGSSRNLSTMAFDAAVLLPTNWRAQIVAYPSFTVLWGVTGNGALQTFTGESITLNTPSVYLQVYNNTGATATITNDSQYYFRLINLNVTTGATTQQAIVRDMLSAVRAVNPSQLAATTSQILSSSLTMPDELYLDANMRDVLDTLTSYGTGDVPPQRLAWRVWADQILRFELLDSGSTTYIVSVGSYQADRALRQTYPQVYASYQDSSDQRQVTSTASATAPRIIRRLAVQSNSTTSVQAAQERDAALADQGDPLPRVSMTIQRLTDANGARVPLYRLKAGDVVQVRDLAPTLSTRVDRFRSFRVIHTSYDLLADTVDVELESPQPRLDWLLARREIGQ